MYKSLPDTVIKMVFFLCSFFSFFLTRNSKNEKDVVCKKRKNKVDVLLFSIIAILISYKGHFTQHVGYQQKNSDRDIVGSR